MPMRAALESRRHSMNFSVRFWNQPWVITIGFYENGNPGEVFTAAAKTPGTDLDAMARDGAILLSLCLQYGVPLPTIRNALTRDANGAPSAITGKITDMMMELQRAKE